MPPGGVAWPGGTAADRGGGDGTRALPPPDATASRALAAPLSAPATEPDGAAPARKLATGGRCEAAPPVPADCCQVAAPARAIRTAAAPARLRPTRAAVPGAAAAAPVLMRVPLAPIRPRRLCPAKPAALPASACPAGPAAPSTAPVALATRPGNPRSDSAARRALGGAAEAVAIPRTPRTPPNARTPESWPRRIAPASRAARMQSQSEASPASASSRPPSRCANRARARDQRPRGGAVVDQQCSDREDRAPRQREYQERRGGAQPRACDSDAALGRHQADHQRSDRVQQRAEQDDHDLQEDQS